jgi:hypothetical protein
MGEDAALAQKAIAASGWVSHALKGVLFRKRAIRPGFLLRVLPRAQEAD